MNYLLRDFVQSGEVEIKTGPFGTQLKASEYVEQGTPVLNVKNLGYSTVVKSKLDRVGPATLDRLNAHILHCGDIVFGRKGAVDRHAYIGSNEEGWMQGSDCIRVRVKTQKINPRYLSYYFLTPEHRAFMISMCSHGTTMASLNRKILEMIEVPMPNRSVQDGIVSLLKILDDKIELNQRINENLERQGHALYKSWFLDFDKTNGKMPHEWCEGTLGKIATISSGKRPPIKRAEATENVQIPIIGASSIMGYTNAVQYNEPILVTGRVGTHGIVQRYHAPCWPSDNTLVIKSDFYEFTYQILQQIDYHNMNRGSTQPLITQTDLKNVSIVLPPITVLCEFERMVGTLMFLYEANRLENERLAVLRDTLLPKLMSGEIDVAGIQL